MAESTVPGPGPVVVQEAGFEAIMHPIGIDAVIGSPSDTAIMYSAGGTLHMTVRANKFALVRGSRWSSGPDEYTVPVEANASGQDRVDRGVLRFHRTGDDRWTIKAAVLTGAPGSTNPPAVTQSEDVGQVWELPLCRFPVPNGATEINPAQVVREEVYIGEEPIHCKDGQRPPHKHGRIIVEEGGKVLISLAGVWRAFALSEGDQVVSFSIGGANPPGPPNVGRVHFVM